MRSEHTSERTGPGSIATSGRLPHQAIAAGGRRPAVLDDLLAFLGDEMQAKAGSFLDHTEQTLNASWSGIKDPAKQSEARAAARWLARSKTTIRDELYRRLVKALTTAPVPKTIDYEGLQLLDDESLGLTVARARLVNKVSERAKHDVASLEARLNTLRKAGILIIPKALSPGHLADGFLETLNDLNIPREAQTLLMEVYGDRGAELLIDFYQKANYFLIERDIQPNAQISGLRSSHNGRERSTVTVAQNLDQKLEVLRQALPRVPLSDWRPGLLLRMFEESPSYGLSRAQLQSIAHVEGIFLELLRDERISARIRGELNRLMLPLLSIRLSDPDQFADADSPVRAFVRQLAMLGYRDAESPLHEFESVHIIVGRVVAEHGHEFDTFHSGSAALHTLARNEAKRSQLDYVLKTAANRSGEGDCLKELSAEEEARRLVMLELREHLAGLTLPAPVHQFVSHLLAPWMLVRWLRYGEDSAPWNEARTFAAVLFDVLRPAVNETDHLRKRSARRFALNQVRLRTERSKLSVQNVSELLIGLEQYFVALDADPNLGLGVTQPTSGSLPG